MLEIRNISKTFNAGTVNEKRALKNVSLTLENGDFVTVIGGKTGTTTAAGSCLVLLSKGSDGTPYISIILKASSGDQLYTDMNRLLNTIK